MGDIEFNHKKVFVLVAERSCINTIGLVEASIHELHENSTTYIVCPIEDLGLFENQTCFSTVVSEDDICQDLTLEAVRETMPPRLQWRAGWYFQQFLKMSFCDYIAEKQPKVTEYVIWDADTVMLKKLSRPAEQEILLLKGRFKHEPYFKTIERTLGITDRLQYSAISQFMHVDVSIMQDLIKQLSSGNVPWYYKLMSELPFAEKSEFSEYETYAAYAVFGKKKKPVYLNEKWFLHGSDYYGKKIPALSQLQLSFSGFFSIAFERHRNQRKWPRNFAISIYAKLCKLLKVMP